MRLGRLSAPERGPKFARRPARVTPRAVKARLIDLVVDVAHDAVEQAAKLCDPVPHGLTFGGAQHALHLGPALECHEYLASEVWRRVFPINRPIIIEACSVRSGGWPEGRHASGDTLAPLRIALKTFARLAHLPSEQDDLLVSLGEVQRYEKWL